MTDAERPVDPERLEQLDEQIERTRHDAEEAGILPDPDEPKFYESGDRSDVDDQTAAPPG